MTDPDTRFDEILRWVDQASPTMDAATLGQLDARVRKVDPSLSQDTLSGLFHAALSNYRNTDNQAFIQVAQRCLLLGLQGNALGQDSRSAYHDFYQILVLPPKRLTQRAIAAVFDLYADTMAAGHAIDGDAAGGYGAVHFLAMLHKDHPAHATALLDRAMATGFDINQEDRVGETPLLGLISRNEYPGRTDMIQAMLCAGADPMRVSAGGRNAWFCAASASDPFGLLDLLAEYTPHAHQRGRMSVDELNQVKDLNQGSGLAAVAMEYATVHAWAQSRMLQDAAPRANAGARPGCRL